jgi:hypothetical protein
MTSKTVQARSWVISTVWYWYEPENTRHHPFSFRFLCSYLRSYLLLFPVRNSKSHTTPHGHIKLPSERKKIRTVNTWSTKYVCLDIEMLIPFYRVCRAPLKIFIS